MSFAKTVVFFLVLRFWVATLRAFSFTCYVVVGPLVRKGEIECVAKAILVVFLGGAAPMSTKGGRVTSFKTRIFDSTMGFPGEDMA